MARKGLMSGIALESEKPMPVNETDGQNTDTPLNPDPQDQAKPETIDAVTKSKIQEDIVAIEEMSDESTQDALQVAEALNVSESLTNGMGLLTDMIGENKTTPGIVRVMDIATESVCLTIGLNPGARIAMENDEAAAPDTANMKDVTGQADKSLLAKMGSKLKEIFQAIVKMLKNSIQQGRAFFQRIFTSVGQLKTQFQKLATASKDWGDVKTDARYTNSADVTMLSMDGKTGETAGVVKNINALAQYNSALQKSGYSETVLESIGELQQMLANKEGSILFQTGREEAFNEAFGRFLDTASVRAFETLRVNNENGNDVTGPDLIGNVRLVSKNDATRAYRHGYLSVKIINGNSFGLVKTEGAQRTDDTLPVLNSQEAKQVLDACYNALTAAEAYKNLTEKQASIKQKIANTLQSVTDELEDQLSFNITYGKNGNWLTHMPLVQSYLNFCVRLLDDLPKLLEVHTLKVMFAAMNWLNFCDKQQASNKKGFGFKGTDQGVADA